MRIRIRSPILAFVNAYRSTQQSPGPSSTVTALVVFDAWRSDCSLSPQTKERMVDVAERFLRFAERAYGSEDLDDVTAAVAAAFIKAHGRRGAPSPATQHLRRSAIRLLFRTARQLGVADGDPTLDIVLPARSRLRARPLDDAEVALCRSFSRHTLTETRLPAVWALSEATARTAELPHLRIGDVDLDRGRVWISGSPRCEPRWGHLTDWGAEHLQRHIERLGATSLDVRLTYSGRGDPTSAQASSCIAVAKVLTLAGLGSEPDVRPISIVAWAGLQVLESSGRIEDVAHALGVRSLDRAAGLIGWDWTDPS